MFDFGSESALGLRVPAASDWILLVELFLAFLQSAVGLRVPAESDDYFVTPKLVFGSTNFQVGSSFQINYRTKNCFSRQKAPNRYVGLKFLSNLCPNRRDLVGLVVGDVVLGD